MQTPTQGGPRKVYSGTYLAQVSEYIKPTWDELNAFTVFYPRMAHDMPSNLQVGVWEEGAQGN